MRAVSPAHWAFPLALALAACNAPPKTDPPKPTPTTTDPATTVPQTTATAGPPKTPSANSDIAAVETQLAGDWETAVQFFDGKTVTQTLSFRKDGTFDQDDAGEGRAPRHSTGIWKVLDGNPGDFMLELAIGEGTKTRVASKYRFTAGGALATKVMDNDVAYVRKGTLVEATKAGSPTPTTTTPTTTTTTPTTTPTTPTPTPTTPTPTP